MAEAMQELYQDTEERPSGIHDLQRKMRLEGTVARTELFGAFIDIGVGVNGLVHISQLRSERVNRVSEVVAEGDKVTVWVLGVDPAKKRIDLTMIEPTAVDWEDIRPGQVYTGRVKRVERFGAFVDIGSTRDGLVHVSELTSDFIRDPKDRVKPGDEVNVKVLKVDQKRRRIELSMKALEEHELVPEVEEVEDVDETLTAMEAAWRDAQADRRERRRRRQKKEREQHERDDVYSRTLRLRGDED